jgi:hypothetical protein
MTTSLKLYIESFFGVREPVFQVFLNDTLLSADRIDVIDRTEFTKKEIIHYRTEFKEDINILKLVQLDKTDNDLRLIDGNFIDHYIKIREVEIDDIKLETALYFANSTFTHFQSDSWVADMASKGFTIDKVMYNQTDIRLNGEWILKFSLPIWKWVIEHIAKSND